MSLAGHVCIGVRKRVGREKIVGVGFISCIIKSKISALAAGIVLAASLAAVASAFSVGSGPDDWWTSEVSHPDWVLDALEEKPVLVYAHLGCDYCKPQTDAVNEIVEEYGDEIEVFDLPADGSDERSEEALAAYDPNGGASLVPLTVILTLAAGDDGEVEVVWHSTEEVSGKEWIQEYVEEAIDYHEENVENWDE